MEITKEFSLCNKIGGEDGVIQDTTEGKFVIGYDAEYIFIEIDDERHLDLKFKILSHKEEENRILIESIEIDGEDNVVSFILKAEDATMYIPNLQEIINFTNK